MKTELIFITILGIIGSLASIISLSLELQILNNTIIHIFYGLLITVITVISVIMIFQQKQKINNYESTVEKIKGHIRNNSFRWDTSNTELVAFYQATKSFVKNNKTFFSKDYDDLIEIANNGIEYNRKGNVDPAVYYRIALELRSKVESHLVRI